LALLKARLREVDRTNQVQRRAQELEEMLSAVALRMATHRESLCRCISDGRHLLKRDNSALLKPGALEKLKMKAKSSLDPKQLRRLLNSFVESLVGMVPVAVAANIGQESGSTSLGMDARILKSSASTLRQSSQEYVALWRSLADRMNVQ
jgi:hypothetical protein